MQPLHFEERTLKPYAEPLSIEELEEGEVYFAIHYCGPDRDGFFPIMETLVFVGFNLDEEDVERRVYFQDLNSSSWHSLWNIDRRGQSLVLRAKARVLEPYLQIRKRPQ